MSHISKIELEINDLKSLDRACQQMGLILNHRQTTFKWYFGSEKCEHAIVVPGAEYEIGVVLKNGNYKLQTDFWDRKIEQMIGKNGGLLKQRYAAEQTKRESTKKGYRVIEKKTENGIRLHIRM